IQNFITTVNNNYYITLLQYELIDYGQKEKFKTFHISLSKKDNKYKVYSTQSSICPQFDQLIDAYKFFNIIEDIDINEITKNNNSQYYYIYTTGKYEIDATNSIKRYIIENNKIKKIDRKDNVKGYYIDIIDDK
ncbi:hypothetical protein, partial [Caldisalinibacter kiritimatiensis]|uniref:hypothetical protein n=1 Tax=Caldisalinibacter kiritimatiensis TaxID=1304284 RepID=UPI0005535943